MIEQQACSCAQSVIEIAYPAFQGSGGAVALKSLFAWEPRVRHEEILGMIEGGRERKLSPGIFNSG